jgi:hypothetical protein
LVQQILQSAPVVQTVLNLRHKVFRHVDGDTPSVRPTVQDITLMLLARQTSRAILANAPAPSQAQRTKSRRPKIRRFTLQPVRDIRGRFRINMLHVRHVRLHTRSSQAKSHGKNRKKYASFCRETPGFMLACVSSPIKLGTTDDRCRVSPSVLTRFLSRFHELPRWTARGRNDLRRSLSTSEGSGESGGFSSAR